MIYHGRQFNGQFTVVKEGSLTNEDSPLSHVKELTNYSL
ncbi:hypothetical protein ADIARSV_3558 [Arcticibacter svalbardensis MN12-7]|uniref:Uncharacterized protein n=1 Tax=Arcticibacter svalbardensis MN12-7 TaxID=1150600 RepID=R9GNJ8_9SPHI|nr:hypothetical protein ADIARSV_3558 [Arcticibacter svalbardensis MN12-7]